MRLDDIRFLVAYDRWATARILAALPGVAAGDWSEANAIGDRGLGGILVHHLGAAQRWRHGLSGAAGELPHPEREQLAKPERLAGLWAIEWQEWDGWLETLDDDALLTTDEEIPTWQLLAHVINHGTQHRSEAAALLTALGRSPGDLDMVFYSEELAAARQASA